MDYIMYGLKYLNLYAINNNENINSDIKNNKLNMMLDSKIYNNENVQKMDIDENISNSVDTNINFLLKKPSAYKNI